MINPLFAKLFGSMLENIIFKWLEERDTRAKGKACFRPKHSTFDHCIDLRHIIENVWEKKEEVFCCFVISENHMKWFLRILSFGTEGRNLGFLNI